MSLPIERIIAAVAVIACGVFLRLHGRAHHIPAFYVKYGGMALWAAMIFFIVALMLRSRPEKQILVIAALVCALVEVSKLDHTPALDIFRLTPVGAWLLGRVFSGWNFLVYAVGIAFAWGLDSVFEGKLVRKSRARRR